MQVKNNTYIAVPHIRTGTISLLAYCAARIMHRKVIMLAGLGDLALDISRGPNHKLTESGIRSREKLVLSV